MQVRNKWNNLKYEVIRVDEKNVTLKRLENTPYNQSTKVVFHILKSEFHFSYVEDKEDK